MMTNVNCVAKSLKAATTEMAEQFIAGTNPTGWDGKGEQPADFLPLADAFVLCNLPCVLQLSLQQDEATHEWKICFEPFDFESNQAYGRFYADNIYSVQNLSDTIFHALWDLFFAEALREDE